MEKNKTSGVALVKTSNVPSKFGERTPDVLICWGRKHHQVRQALRSKLRVAREAKGLSAAELGRLSGRSGKQITRYETGKTPITLDVARLIAPHLDCDPYDILGEEHDEGLKAWIDFYLRGTPEQRVQALRVVEALTAGKPL